MEGPHPDEHQSQEERQQIQGARAQADQLQMALEFGLGTEQRHVLERPRRRPGLVGQPAHPVEVDRELEAAVARCVGWNRDEPGLREGEEAGERSDLAGLDPVHPELIAAVPRGAEQERRRRDAAAGQLHGPPVPHRAVIARSELVAPGRGEPDLRPRGYVQRRAGEVGPQGGPSEAPVSGNVPCRANLLGRPTDREGREGQEGQGESQDAARASWRSRPQLWGPSRRPWNHWVRRSHPGESAAASVSADSCRAPGETYLAPPMTQERRALVTGATGFVGSHLVRHLTDAGWTVHALVRAGSSAYRPVASIHVHDGSTEGLVEIVGAVRPDVVFHLASLFIGEHRTAEVTALVESNLLFSTQLAEAMRVHGRTRLVNTGTVWQHFHDQDYLPVNLYAATKQAYLDILRFFEEAAGLRVITL